MHHMRCFKKNKNKKKQKKNKKTGLLHRQKKGKKSVTFIRNNKKENICIQASK